MSRTIYLATAGQWEDKSVVAAFSREEDARAFDLGDDVEEVELYDGPVEVCDWHRLSWWPEVVAHTPMIGDTPFPNPYERDERRAFTGDPQHVEHAWEIQSKESGAVLRVGGWELERVRKVFSEQRAQYIATHGQPAAVQTDPGSSA